MRTRRDAIVILKGDLGLLVPVIYCKEHDVSKHALYDLCYTEDSKVNLVILLVRYGCSVFDRASCKHTARHTSKRLFHRPTHCCEKLCG